jgi:hypothetical protein
MRTAEEILDSIDSSRMIYHANAKSAIRIAMKEAIVEASESATAFSIGYDGHPQVDKQSILKLIDQIK